MSDVCSWAGVPDQSWQKELSESLFLELFITSFARTLFCCRYWRQGFLFLLCLWELSAIHFVRYSSFSVAQTCPSPPHWEGLSGSEAPSVPWCQAVVFQPFRLSVTAVWMGLYHKASQTASFFSPAVCFNPQTLSQMDGSLNMQFSHHPVEGQALRGHWTWWIQGPSSSASLSSPPCPLGQGQGGKKITYLPFTPCPSLVPILHPSMGDVATEGTASWHAGKSSPGGCVGRQEISCLLVRMMFKDVGISVGTLC